jgi:peptide/nickel transport system substrate-binding protein
MLLRGEADIIDQVPLEQLTRLRAQPGVRVIIGQGLRVLFLCLRVDRAPFSDPRVREAVDLAIDRRQLVERALAGQAEPASQLVPPTVVGYNPAIGVTRADPERARRLLAEAGYPQGLSLRLDGTNNRYVNDGKILVEIARQLGEVGVHIEVNAMEKRLFFPLIKAGRSQLHLLGWACQTGEAGDALDSVIHSPEGGHLGSNNTTGLSDPTLDRLIERANSSLSLRHRTAVLQETLSQVVRARATIPLVIQTESLAMKEGVRWDPSVRFALNLQEIGWRR